MSVSIIPESAPFNAEQRAWLNGFLAGWTGASGGQDAVGALAGGAAMLTGPDTASEEQEDFPWHDPNLAIDERLALAEEKPLERKLMAAMAQLDCGSCGYLCQTYSEAIAAGEENNLTLCSPGGKETAKALKRLVKEKGANGKPASARANGAPKAAETGYTRARPYTATVTACHNLNGEGSAKHTSHVVIDLGDSGITYRVGDALGVYPTNCPELVGDLLEHLDLADDTTLRDQLTAGYNLRDVSDELLELLSAATPDADEELAVGALVDSDDLDTLDVLDVLRRAPSAKLSASDFTACLNEIAPRLYSIASSLAAHPGEVHLTVGKATARSEERVYKGVASTMFADRIQSGDTVRVFVQPSHGFGVPNDPAAPMIMVGPGTGVAPFRAFLEERQATSATGKNWLFFGDQHQATDYLYAGEFAGMQASGLLNKVSLAFSRDQEEKVYVQDRMRAEGGELYSWIEDGGYFFVCGDARRMAADVDRALHDVVAEHGRLSPDGAKAYVDRMKQEGRYARDVY